MARQQADKLKRIAKKLFTKMNDKDPKVRIKAKNVHDKLKKVANSRGPVKQRQKAMAILKYVKGYAAHEQGDRVMGLCH